MGSIYSSQIRTYNDSDYKHHQSPTWCLQKVDLAYLKEIGLEVTSRSTNDTTNVHHNRGDSSPGNRKLTAQSADC